MSEKPTIRMELDRKVQRGIWERCLPAGSQITQSFCGRIRLVVEGGTQARPLADHPTSPMRLFVGDEPRCEYTQDVFATFGLLLPEVLDCITRLTHGCTALVFFSGPATHEEMFEMWPFLPFGPKDGLRFYVSEITRDSRIAPLPRVWLCLEYAYEPFRRLLGPDGFDYSYGITIMGMLVREQSVKMYLTRDPRNRSMLEESLTSDELRGWWMCDADFDGITIWHKDYTADELAEHLQAIIAH